MQDSLRVSPRYLGRMLLDNFCLRCFFYLILLRFRLPFDIPMPGLMFHLAGGKERREKANTKSVGKLFYQKRNQEVLEGRKPLEKLRARTVLFGQRVEDAIEQIESQAIPGKDGRHSCKIDLIRDAFGSAEAARSLHRRSRVGSPEGFASANGSQRRQTVIKLFFLCASA